MATKLLINEPPLQVLPTLATWIGLNEAIFLQQLHYWTSNPKIGKTHEGHKWVRNTVKEWKENFPFWGVNTIRRAIANLEKRELIFSTDTLNKHNYDKSKWYAINYEKLNTLNGPIDQEKEPEKPTTQNGQRVDPLPKMGNGVTQNGQQVLPKMGRPIPETNDRLPENTPPTEKNSSTGKDDYLSSIVLSAKNGTEKDQPAYAPDPFWGYRDAFLDIFNKKTGRYPSEIEKAEIVSLSEKSDACPHKWEESIKTAVLNHNFGKPTLQRCIEIYKAGGTWELFREWKWGSQDEDAAKIPLTDSEKEAVKRLNAQMQAEMAAV